MREEIVYGIIASAIFGLLMWMVKEWLVPMYQAFVYDGAKLTGTWQAYFEGEPEPFATIEFKQSGRTISGDAHVTKNKHGVRRDRRYRYRGRSLNNSIILLFEDRKHPGVYGGTTVLHTTDSDGTRMRGLSIFYKPEAFDVVSARVELCQSGTPREPVSTPSRTAANV